MGVSQQTGSWITPHMNMKTVIVANTPPGPPEPTNTFTCACPTPLHAMQAFRYQDGFQAVRVGVDAATGQIGHLELARPAASNAFNAVMWEEFPRAVRLLQQQPDIRVCIISAAGKNFCGGLDLSYLSNTFGAKMSPAAGPNNAACPARLRDGFRQDILQMQEAYSVLEACRWPVIAAVHGACVGAGVDLVTAADLRYCSADAAFCVKEVDLAITADLGTLQRLPSIVGHGVAAELALTARVVRGPEAQQLGLVSRCYDSREALMSGVVQLAGQIAVKSPLAVAGTKAVLLHTRDSPAGVSDKLSHVALWNSAYLLSDDMARLIQARAQKQAPVFSKL